MLEFIVHQTLIEHNEALQLKNLRKTFVGCHVCQNFAVHFKYYIPYSLYDLNLIKMIKIILENRSTGEIIY